jgi:hypothetical protein
MSRQPDRCHRGTWPIAAALVLASLAGCGNSGPKTYPVKGKIEFADGDVKQLAGQYVEFKLESDPPLVVSGEIQDDGTFTLGMLHEGKLYKGAPEGTYRARIVLPEEEDEEGARRRPTVVHSRFLDFDRSGLSFKLPTSGDITVKVSRR